MKKYTLISRSTTAAVLLCLLPNVSFAQENKTEFASYAEEVLQSSSRQPLQISKSASPLDESAQVTNEAANRLPQPPAPLPPFTFAPDMDTRNLLLKFTAGAVLSASLGFAIIYVGGKWIPRRNGRGNGIVQIVDTLPMGPKAFVQLMRVRDQFILVACDASGIREMVPLQSEFDDHLQTADRDTREFERAAEALLTQKGVAAWKQAKLRER